MGHVDSIAAVVVLQAVVVIVCKLLSNISRLSPCTLSSLRLKMSYKFLLQLNLGFIPTNFKVSLNFILITLLANSCNKYSSI